MELSKEQKDILDVVKKGENVYIDACIGSGKTTLLNEICKEMYNKKILYLTYNKLLKEDAKKQIISRNVEIHNYHGFAFKYLKINRYGYTHQDGIKNIVNLVETGAIRLPQYDIILIDEYQDINEDAADLITCIEEEQKENTQIVFVGDMKQKIYSTTKLDVLDFIFNLKKDYKKMDLTNCFRLNKDHAKMLGNIWQKEIIGVNEEQKVSVIEFVEHELIELLTSFDNKDILILSPFRNNVLLNRFVNALEKTDPIKYNKKNLYITINDTENSSTPVDGSMIVTTFDGSKGLERKIAIVFGFETDALEFRSRKGDKEVTKNLFLVAASRGKKEIIFIKEKEILNEYNFKKNLVDRVVDEDFNPSTMFDFCYNVDIDKTYENLEIKKIEQEDKKEIETTSKDYNILLGPAIGVYQEAMFFKDWSYEKNLDSYKKELPIVKYIKKTKPQTLNKKVLCLTAIETNLMRYYTQAIENFIDMDNELDLYDRLQKELDPNLPSQIFTSCALSYTTRISGTIDTVKDNVPYELKFVTVLEKKHFLQLASYMLSGFYEKGILWNTRTNDMYEVKIKNRENFKNDVQKTIRKES